MQKAHRQQLERLHYQIKLAKRQFDQVDPDNRLVAASLEKRWEEALSELRRAEGSIKMRDRMPLVCRRREPISWSCWAGPSRRFSRWHRDSFCLDGTRSYSLQTWLPRLVINDVRSKQVLPSDASICPPTWALGHAFPGKTAPHLEYQQKIL